MYINSNIAYLIKKNRLKLREFGESIGVTQDVANSYKSGRSLPKLDTLLKISETFNISCDDLLKKDLSKESNANTGLMGGKNDEKPSTQLEKLALEVVKNEKELMEIDIVANIVNIRVAKEVLKITTSKENLMKYLDS